jgi:hypothetical protein
MPDSSVSDETKRRALAVRFHLQFHAGQLTLRRMTSPGRYELNGNRAVLNIQETQYDSL